MGRELKSFTVYEYAERKNIAVNTVYRQLRAGKLSYYKDGRNYMITGKKSGCKFTKIYPGDPAEHLKTECGNTIYVITDAVKTFKYCPWCGLEIVTGDIEDDQ